MKVVVMSSPDAVSNEAAIVNEMFRNDLQYFHIRKPDFSEVDLKRYLDKIEPEYYDRIIIHDHYEVAGKYRLGGIHISRENYNPVFLWFVIKYYKWKFRLENITTSFHGLSGLSSNANSYSYVFLSPMFRRKPTGKREMVYSESKLNHALKKASNKIFAMGRMKIEDIDDLLKMNFDGLCFMNAIWRSDDPLQAYLDISRRCSKVIKLAS